MNAISGRHIYRYWFSFPVGGKQPGFSGEADAHTTDVVNGRFRVTGRTISIGD